MRGPLQFPTITQKKKKTVCLCLGYPPQKPHQSMVHRETFQEILLGIQEGKKSRICNRQLIFDPPQPA